MQHGRALLVLATATSAWLALALLGLDAAHDLRADQLPTRLAALAGTALVLGATWGWLAVSVTVLDHLRGRRTARRCVPTALRCTVLAMCGVALVAGNPGAAQATRVGAPPGAGTDVTVLSGLPYPDRALGGPPPRRAPGQPHQPIEVRPGDSLWAISARRGPHPEAPATAAEVARLYRLNLDVVGEDPDLIHPGQRLRLPRTWPRSHRTDPRQEQS